MDFPVEIISLGLWNSDISRKGQTVSKKRRLSMFEVELPIEPGGVSYVSDVSHPVSPDTLIFARPGDVRYSRFPLRCYYLHFSVGEGELYSMLSRIPSFITTGRAEKYREIFSDMCTYYATGDKLDILMVKSRVFELIYNLLSEGGARLHIGGVQGGAIEECVRYVKENLTEELSLPTLAERAGFSPAHFHSKFKTAVGKTLREFVEDERIRRAVELLTSTDKTLTEIAYESGFSSQSYFSYAFKRKMGKTPREYASWLFSKYDGAE